MNRALAIALVLCAVATAKSTAAPLSYLHYFSGPDGHNARNGLVTDGQRLYGTTELGGTAGGGVIFACDFDGQEFELLHQFDSPSGIYPVGTLAFSEGRLYGVASAGGATGLGNVFTLRTDGSDYAVLHDFTGLDGARPLAGVVVLDSKLYGTTNRGGGFGLGTVYSLDNNGANYQVLHHFNRGIDDGAGPTAPLTFFNSQLYGTSLGGGTFDQGGIYSLGLDGAGFRVHHSFSVEEGFASGGLTPATGRLYGATGLGGRNQLGMLFSIDDDGSDFQVLHDFNGLDGVEPLAELTAVGSTLFGTTAFGSAVPGAGVVFSIGADGSAFTVLHDFAGPPKDGDGAWAPVLAFRNRLYGTTIDGGPADAGTVFSIAVPEPSSLLLAVTALIAVAIRIRGQFRFISR
jgi:uncharacterized repeat protein (TIGR03803 family)